MRRLIAAHAAATRATTAARADRARAAARAATLHTDAATAVRALLQHGLGRAGVTGPPLADGHLGTLPPATAALLRSLLRAA